MLKWVKFLVGLALLPLCIGAARALGQVIQATGRADTVWVAMLAGAACWVIVFLLLPKPMLLYVYGHELTHALWTWIFLGRVKRFKAAPTGGHVIISKTNFLIALAPYFFPFYAFLVVAVFSIGHLLWGWQSYLVWFHLLLGAAYAFHVTLTGHALRTRQTDITSQGYLFSAVIIWLGNITGLLIGIPLVTGQVGVLTAFGWCLRHTGTLLSRLGQWI